LPPARVLYLMGLWTVKVDKTMQKSTLSIMLAGLMVASLLAVNPLAAQGEGRDIGSRLELFVDHYLIDKLNGTELWVSYLSGNWEISVKERPQNESYIESV